MKISSNLFRVEKWSLTDSNRYNFWIIFLINSFACWGIILISERLIFTDDFYNVYYSQLSTTLAESALNFQNQFWWIGYLSKSLFILTNLGFTFLCIAVGAILADVEFKAYSLFITAIIAQWIFILADLLFLCSLYINIEIVTFETLANYFPLSLLSFLGAENVVPWLHYPLQTLNLFEVFYVLLISWLLSKQWKPEFVESLNIVIPSYGIGLLLWMALVVFLTLQIS